MPDFNYNWDHASINALFWRDTRLVSLGFTPGAEVSMSQNYGRGPLIVTVRGTHVALGRVEAAKIFVEQSAE